MKKISFMVMALMGMVFMSCNFDPSSIEDLNDDEVIVAEESNEGQEVSESNEEIEAGQNESLSDDEEFDPSSIEDLNDDEVIVAEESNEGQEVSESNTNYPKSSNCEVDGIADYSLYIKSELNRNGEYKYSNKYNTIFKSMILRGKPFVIENKDGDEFGDLYIKYVENDILVEVNCDSNKAYIKNLEVNKNEKIIFIDIGKIIK